MSKELTQERLKKLLHYEPDTGVFTWIGSTRAGINGKEAGCVKDGYIAIGISGRVFYAHRLVWMYVHAEWPDQIDHINHDRSDNRIENLRSVSHLENGMNQSKPSDNTSGCVGVTWNGNRCKWAAQMKANGKNIWLGLHDNKNDAIAARKDAEKIHGFHENHGIMR